MSGKLHYQEHNIEEVFDHFADAFESPAGMEIRKVTPHYDPRRGSVIFAIYMEPTDGAPTSDAPAADSPTTDH